MNGTILEHGPEHPITIEPTPGRVVVTVAGNVVADSTRALTLREANYPPVQYIPMDDLDDTLLEASATSTSCPYKGAASYFSVPVGGEGSVDALWVYPTPHAAVLPIAGHAAFYPDRVDEVRVDEISVDERDVAEGDSAR